MWKSVSGRNSSSLTKLRSVLIASEKHYKILTLISPSSFSYSSHHFYPNAFLRPIPKFFSQSPTYSGDPPSSDPVESHRKTSVHVSGDNTIFPDTIEAFGVADSGNVENDGVDWSDSKKSNEIEPMSNVGSDKGAFHVDADFDNAENGGVEWSGAKQSSEIKPTNVGISDNDVPEKSSEGSESIKIGGEDNGTFTDGGEKIRRVLDLLQGEMNVSVEESLADMHLDLDEGFVLKILNSVNPRWHSIYFFHWALRQASFSPTSKMLDVLLSIVSYTEIGTREKGLFHTKFFNELISILSGLEVASSSLILGIIERFDEFGCVPDVETREFLLKALCKLRMVERVLSLCKEMLDAGSLTPYQTENVMEILCGQDLPIEALELYSMAKEKDLSIEDKRISFLIEKLSVNPSMIQASCDVVKNLPSDVRKRAHVLFEYLMQGLCESSNLEDGKKLIYSMIELGPPPGYIVFNLIITNFSNAGRMDEAMEMIELMKTRGLKPDAHAYKCMLRAFASRNMMEEAMPVFHEADKYHPGSNYVTFDRLIREFCNVRDFEMAKKLFEHMMRCDLGRSRRCLVFNYMVGVFSKAGRIDEVLEMYELMKTRGLEPDFSYPFFDRIITGLCKLGDYEAAMKFFAHMKSCGVVAHARLYHCLIRLVCFRGLDWEKAQVLVKEMRAIGDRRRGMTELILDVGKEVEEMEFQEARRLKGLT